MTAPLFFMAFLKAAFQSTFPFLECKKYANMTSWGFRILIER